MRNMPKKTRKTKHAAIDSSRKGKHDDTESESEREESHSSSEDEDLSSESSGGDVQADFAFFDPKPDDFHGVKVLMTTYLDNKAWALSSFVDLILEQTTVGTVIKIEGDEDNGIYGFVSALNLQRYKDHKCMTEVKEFLLKVCPDKEIKDKMESYLGPQAADVGLLVSQYVVNLPQLLPPLYDGLFDEFLWATEDEPTKELRKSFCFKHYLLVSKVYKHKNGDQKKKNNKGSSSSEADIIYLKAEDEIFHNLSAWSFFFPLRAQQVTTSEDPAAFGTKVIYGDVYMLDDKMGWHRMPPLPKPDSHTEASWALLNNSIVIAGGTTEKNPVTKRMILVGELFRFDLDSLKWHVIGKLPYRVKTTQAAYWNGWFYITSGQRDKGPDNPQPKKVVADLWRTRLSL